VPQTKVINRGPGQASPETDAGHPRLTPHAVVVVTVETVGVGREHPEPAVGDQFAPWIACTSAGYHRPMLRRMGLALGPVILSILAVGCGTTESTSEIAPSQSQSATGGSRQATSPAWDAEGNRLREFKRTRNGGPQPIGGLPGNAGDYAFRSSPVDIVKEGERTVSFGPLPGDFDYPKTPSALAYNFPTDAQFSIIPLTARMTSANGTRFLELTVRVSDFREPYTHYSVWLY